MIGQGRNTDIYQCLLCKDVLPSPYIFTLHITDGWNYAVRFYQPRKEIFEGARLFPKVIQIQQSF